MPRFHFRRVDVAFSSVDEAVAAPPVSPLVGFCRHGATITMTSNKGRHNGTSTCGRSREKRAILKWREGSGRNDDWLVDLPGAHHLHEDTPTHKDSSPTDVYARNTQAMA